jgi:uncharacterized protein YjiS (DUF1127 family)
MDFVMSIHIANSQLSFELPSMSYVDVRWEEPDLHAQVNLPPVPRKRGLAAWLSRHLTAFLAWRRDRQTVAELSSMSDYELKDIGLSRADVARVCNPNLSVDLGWRGTGA